MEAANEKRWSVTVSDLQAWTYTGLPDARYALETLFFFFFFPRTTVFLAGPHAVSVSVWNGGLTESIASVHYLHRVPD